MRGVNNMRGGTIAPCTIRIINLHQELEAIVAHCLQNIPVVVPIGLRNNLITKQSPL